MKNIPKPTGTTNELAKERNRAAGERTLAAWIQNSLVLIGCGIAFDQIFEALILTFEQISWDLVRNMTHILGLNFILWGLGLLILGMMQYRIEVQSIERDDYIVMPSRSLNLSVGSAIIVFGLATSIIILL